MGGGGNAEAILKSPTYLSQDAIKVERNFLGSSGFIWKQKTENIEPNRKRSLKTLTAIK